MLLNEHATFPKIYTSKVLVLDKKTLDNQPDYQTLYIITRERTQSICIFILYSHKNSKVRNKYILYLDEVRFMILFCILF